MARIADFSKADTVVLKDGSIMLFDYYWQSYCCSESIVRFSGRKMRNMASLIIRQYGEVKLGYRDKRFHNIYTDYIGDEVFTENANFYFYVYLKYNPNNDIASIRRKLYDNLLYELK